MLVRLVVWEKTVKLALREMLAPVDIKENKAQQVKMVSQELPERREPPEKWALLVSLVVPEVLVLLDLWDLLENRDPQE